MSDEVVDFDIDDFLSRIHGNKPPFKCPATYCQKICKSYKSIEAHMKQHRAPEPIVIPIDFDETKQQEQTLSNSTCQPSISNPQLLSPMMESKKYVMLDAVNSGAGNNAKDKSRQNLSFRVNIQNPLNIILINDPEREETVEPKLNLPIVDYKIDNGYNLKKKFLLSENTGYMHFKEQSEEELDKIIEYDLDEEDTLWLDKVNEKRKCQNLPTITQEGLEWIIDRFEKLSKFHRVKQDHLQKKTSKSNLPLTCIEDDPTDDAVCAVCLDGSCENTNVILFCDVCNLPVHQECYGVPYIPEGSWLCRKCLHSPSEPVQCVLCPNAGGAFKKTSDERWAHVICGLWIPEVVFANLTFLEPLEDIDKVAPARWKLKCFICKKKNSGACIQCHKTSCYRAFHVTCAQQAGLYMKIEDDVKGNGIKKSAFCDMHSPADYKNDPANRSMYAKNESSEDESKLSDNESLVNSEISFLNSTKCPSKKEENKMSQERLNNVRKALVKKRITQEQSIQLPYVSDSSINEILHSTQFEDFLKTRLDEKQRFQILCSAYSFWKMKRSLRRGVPLLKRLQTSTRNPKVINLTTIEDNAGENADPANNDTLAEQSKLLHILRQDLERTRLLSELAKKRERVKRDIFKIFTRQIEIYTQPIKIFLEKVIEILQEKDKHNMFAEPVTDKIAPSYSKIIKNPMDFGTIKKKCTALEYLCVADLAKDYHLMMDNCLTYNMKDSIFYKTAARLRSYGDEILAEATNVQNRMGINPKTGMFHDDENPLISESDLWNIFTSDNLDLVRGLLDDSCRQINIDALKKAEEDAKAEQKEAAKLSQLATAGEDRGDEGPPANDEVANSAGGSRNRRSKRFSNASSNSQSHTPTIGQKRPHENDQNSSPYATRSSKMTRLSSPKNISTLEQIANSSLKPLVFDVDKIDSIATNIIDKNSSLFSLANGNPFSLIQPNQESLQESLPKNTYKDRPNFQEYQNRSPRKVPEDANKGSVPRYPLREKAAKGSGNEPFQNYETEDDSTSPTSTSDEESCYSSEQESIFEHSVSEVNNYRGSIGGMMSRLENENRSFSSAKDKEKNETNGDIAEGKRRLRNTRLSTTAHASPGKIERSPLSVRNQIMGISKFAPRKDPSKQLLIAGRRKKGYFAKRKRRLKNKDVSYLLINDETSQDSVQMYNPDECINIRESSEPKGSPLTNFQDVDLTINENSGKTNQSFPSSTSPAQFDSQSLSLYPGPNQKSTPANPLSSACSSVDLSSPSNCQSQSSSLIEMLSPVWAKCHGSPWYPGLIMNPLLPMDSVYEDRGLAIPTAPRTVLITGLEHLWLREESAPLRSILLSRLSADLPQLEDLNRFHELDNEEITHVYLTIDDVMNAHHLKSLREKEFNDSHEERTGENQLVEAELADIRESCFIYLVLFFDQKKTWQWLPMDKLKPMFTNQAIDATRLTHAKKSRMKLSIQKAYTRGVKHFSQYYAVSYPFNAKKIITLPYIFNPK